MQYRFRSLLKVQRLTRLRQAYGRPVKADLEVEEHVVKCIEEKSTFHGRRHDSVLYTSHRVLSKDLCKIANQTIIARGGTDKDLIRSSSTVRALMKPINKRTRAGTTTSR